MRSELVFAAERRVGNRYLLMRAASMATRKFHRPNSSIKETINDALLRLTLADKIGSIRRPPETGRDRLNSDGIEAPHSGTSQAPSSSPVSSLQFPTEVLHSCA